MQFAFLMRRMRPLIASLIFLTSGAGAVLGGEIYEHSVDAASQVVETQLLVQDQRSLNDARNQIADLKTQMSLESYADPSHHHDCLTIVTRYLHTVGFWNDMEDVRKDLEITSKLYSFTSPARHAQIDEARDKLNLARDRLQALNVRLEDCSDRTP